MRPFRNLLLTLGLCTSLFCSLHAQAQSGRMDASEKISYGTLSIVASPAMISSDKGGPVGSAFAGLLGSYLVVAGSAEAGKDVAEFTMEGVSNGSRVSVQVSKSAAEKIGVSVGTTVDLVSHTTGAILVVSGKVLAFVPNTLGESLLHQERITSTEAPQSAQSVPVEDEAPAPSLKPTGY